MNSVSVLDCTLRDGGYCNNWKFGRDLIPKIIRSLSDSGIEIVECGFLTDRTSFDPDRTKYPDIGSVSKILPENRKHTMYVVMMNYGEYDASAVPECEPGRTADGIRVAFHKKNLAPALEDCRILKEKGYKVFVQAMVSLTYSDREFLSLISAVNDVNPYAFYIVDSFGNMRYDDLVRYFSLAENNLSKEILIGFHSHNNLQLAYSNARALVERRTVHGLIIDSSVYGMGRGAGNLNTELFVEYLNRQIGKEYRIKPLLEIMDYALNNFYLANPWGYSLPNYLSAVNNAHPNYAGFLADKNSLTIDAMNEIFQLMDPAKKLEFDREYAESIYLRYMESKQDSTEHREELADAVRGRTVLLISPGTSSRTESSRIAEYAARDVISVSINFPYPYCRTDFIFVSNIRRFGELPAEDKARCILTSNIVSDVAYTSTDYRELLNDVEPVTDNAGMMAVKLFWMLGASKIVLAGFDGYSFDAEENYADSRMTIITKRAILEGRNEGMAKVLGEYSKKMKIEFLTPPLHYKVE